MVNGNFHPLCSKFNIAWGGRGRRRGEVGKVTSFTYILSPERSQHFSSPPDTILVLRTSTWHLFLGIHIDGAFEIADALKKNNTLEVLRIGKNSFQSFGACLLLRGLRYNQTSALRELILDDVAFDR